MTAAIDTLVAFYQCKRKAINECDGASHVFRTVAAALMRPPPPPRNRFMGREDRPPGPRFIIIIIIIIIISFAGRLHSKPVANK